MSIMADWRMQMQMQMQMRCVEMDLVGPVMRPGFVDGSFGCGWELDIVNK